MLGPHLRKQASTAPNQVGEILSLLGVQSWAKKVDHARRVQNGSTVDDLGRINKRRNRIAHEADRVGRRRAPIKVAEVVREIAALRSIVQAIEEVLSG